MAVQDNKAYREALKAESVQLFPGKSRKAKLARKEWRNAQRAEHGFRAESKLARGGLAGVWDRNKNVIKPIAAGLAGLATGGLLAPMAVGALASGLDREGKGGIGFDVGQGLRGAAEGALAGSVGKGVGSLLRPSAANFAASIPGAPSVGATPVAAGSGAGATGGMSGVLGRAKDWALADGGRNLLGLASGAYGVYKQAQGNQMMTDAAKRDAARWAEGAPLRAQGMQGLLNPVPVNTSELAFLGSQGNPFARKAPAVPGAGALAGNAAEERPGLQMKPIPATAMRGRR